MMIQYFIEPQYLFDRMIETIKTGDFTKDLTDVKCISDPACGSGSLLIQVADRLKEKDVKFIHIYGQELNTTTCNLARMNMLVHSICISYKRKRSYQIERKV